MITVMLFVRILHYFIQVLLENKSCICFPCIEIRAVISCDYSKGPEQYHPASSLSQRCSKPSSWPCSKPAPSYSQSQQASSQPCSKPARHGPTLPYYWRYLASQLAQLVASFDSQCRGWAFKKSLGDAYKQEWAQDIFRKGIRKGGKVMHKHRATKSTVN